MADAAHGPAYEHTHLAVKAVGGPAQMVGEQRAYGLGALGADAIQQLTHPASHGAQQLFTRAVDANQGCGARGAGVDDLWCLDHDRLLRTRC